VDELAEGHSPPGIEGVAAPLIKRREGHVSGADGVVEIAQTFQDVLLKKGSIPDHPVRSIKGGFATSS
jgi:hypothetical protein